MADLFLVSEPTRNKLEELVKHRRDPAKPVLAGGAAREPGVQLLEIQSGAADADGYPARLQDWAGSGTTADFSTDEVRVIDFNGGTFEVGQVVEARFLGLNASGVGCYSSTLPDGVTGDYTTYNVDGIISTADQYLGDGIKRAYAVGVSGTTTDAGPSAVTFVGTNTGSGTAGVLYVLGSTNSVTYGTGSTEPLSVIKCLGLQFSDEMGTGSWSHILTHYSDTDNRAVYYNGTSTSHTSVTYDGMRDVGYQMFFRMDATASGSPVTYYGINAPRVQATEYWIGTGTTIYRGLSGSDIVGNVFAGGIITNFATGPIGVASGGTGGATFTVNRLIQGNGTSALSSVTTLSGGTW